MPFVQAIVKEVFEGLPLSRTLNTAEAVANGCAIQAKMMETDSFFKFEMEEYSTQAIVGQL